MSFKRVFAITKRIFRGIRHDRRTLALILIAPVMAMLLFGITFSGDVKHVDVSVVDYDGGLLSRMIISNMDEDSTIDVNFKETEAEAIKRVEDGKSWAAIIFPQGFTDNVLASAGGGTPQQGNSITVRADESNPRIAASVMMAVTNAMMLAVEQSGRELPVSIEGNAVYGKGAKFIDSFVPGIMAFAVFLLTTLLTLLAFVGERTAGTLARLLVSPLRAGEIVAGYALAFGIIGMIQASLLLIVAVLAFDIMIEGSPLLAYVIIAELAAVSVSLGILLSSAARREAQAVQFLPIIIWPVFMFSGIFWPVEAIPSVIRPLSYFVPTTYGVDAIRSVMLRGWGLGDIWPQVLALAAFALVFLSASVLSLKRKTK